MAVTVRINEDNYQALKELADKERRSVVSQLGVILDNYFHRDTVGHVTPPEIGLPQKIETPKTPKIASEATPVDVSDLFVEPGTVVEGNTLGEFDCCSHPSRPCKHWIWDADRGEGYKNVLSGRFREAD